jgi:hypothetical protein
VTRAWVAESLVRDWGDKVQPGQETDAKWKKGETNLSKLLPVPVPYGMWFFSLLLHLDCLS